MQGITARHMFRKMRRPGAPHARHTDTHTHAAIAVCQKSLPLSDFGRRGSDFFFFLPLFFLCCCLGGNERNDDERQRQRTPRPKNTHLRVGLLTARADWRLSKSHSVM